MAPLAYQDKVKKSHLALQGGKQTFMKHVILCQVLGYTLHILRVSYHVITSSKVGLITASHRGGSRDSEILSTWPKPHS